MMTFMKSFDLKIPVFRVSNTDQLHDVYLTVAAHVMNDYILLSGVI